MQIVLIVLFTVVGGMAAFGLFMGTDELTARLRGRPGPSFDWFDGGVWGGAPSSSRTAIRWAGTVLAGLAWTAIAVVALGLLLAGAAHVLLRLIS